MKNLNWKDFDLIRTLLLGLKAKWNFIVAFSVMSFKHISSNSNSVSFSSYPIYLKQRPETDTERVKGLVLKL